MYPFEDLNHSLFLRLNAGSDAPTRLLQIAVVVAEYVIYLIPLFLIWIWITGSRTQREQAIRAVVVTVLALGLAQVIGFAWPHPRPFMVPFGHTWVQHAADPSFPSDHITVFAGIGLSLFFSGAVRRACVVAVFGLAVAWSRIFLGVHFPFDMVGAIAVAALACALVTPIWNLVGVKVTDVSERIYGTFSKGFSHTRRL